MVEYQGASIDLTPPWRRVTMHELVREAMPDKFDFEALSDTAEDLEKAKAAAAAAGVPKASEAKSVRCSDESDGAGQGGAREAWRWGGEGCRGMGRGRVERGGMGFSRGADGERMGSERGREGAWGSWSRRGAAGAGEGRSGEEGGWE